MDKFTLKPENDRKMTKIYDEASQSMQGVAWEAKFWKFMKGRKDFGIIDPMEYIGNADKMEEFIGMLGMRGKGVSGKGQGSEGGVRDGGSEGGVRKRPRGPGRDGGGVRGGVGAEGGVAGKAGKRNSMPDSVGQVRDGFDPRRAGVEIRTPAKNELQKSDYRDLSSEC